MRTSSEGSSLVEVVVVEVSSVNSIVLCSGSDEAIRGGVVNKGIIVL